MAIAFHDHINFCGERAKIVGITPLKETIKLFPQELTDLQQLRKHEILSWYDAVTFERFGVLQGEYVLIQNGMALMDRNGLFIMIGLASSEKLAGQFDERMRVIDAEKKQAILKNWENIPVARNPAIISDRYGNNYWHLTLEVIPRFRFYENYKIEYVIIPETHLKKRFQTDLYIKSIGNNNNNIVVPSSLIKVINPVLAFSPMSTLGVQWLRRMMNISVNNGSKRYYIRRGESMTRSQIGGGDAHQGGLVENENLIKFLDHYDFQMVDFGSGENSVEEQVKRLDGAHIILASHGAHLTNIVYLNPPLTIIEILGPDMYNASYLSIANELSFHYFGITTDWLDHQGNMVVDCEKLHEIMGEVLGDVKKPPW